MSKTTVAVLYPTCGRAEQARKHASAMLGQKYPRGLNVVLIASVEDTDSKTRDAMASLSPDYPERVHIIVRAPDTSAVYGWNQAYAYAREIGATWAVLGADDMNWHEGWLDKALALAKETGAAVIGLPDGHDMTRKYAPHYMLSIAFADEHLGGVMAVPHYRSWAFDYEASERADMANKYAQLSEPALTHYHPDWNTAPMDGTYKKAWPAHEADMALRLQRRKQGYPTDYEPAVLGGDV